MRNASRKVVQVCLGQREEIQISLKNASGTVNLAANEAVDSYEIFTLTKHSA
jgi:hypothetical protein